VAHPALYSFALRPVSRNAPTPRAIRAAATPALFCVLWGMPLGVTLVPNCTASLGTLSYSVGTAATASITTNTTTNQVTITAEQPGTTAITASVAGTGSSAGYFSTCRRDQSR